MLSISAQSVHSVSGRSCKLRSQLRQLSWAPASEIVTGKAQFGGTPEAEIMVLRPYGMLQRNTPCPLLASQYTHVRMHTNKETTPTLGKTGRRAATSLTPAYRVRNLR